MQVAFIRGMDFVWHRAFLNIGETVEILDTCTGNVKKLTDNEFLRYAAKVSDIYGLDKVYAGSVSIKFRLFDDFEAINLVCMDKEVTYKGSHLFTFKTHNTSDETCVLKILDCVNRTTLCCVYTPSSLSAESVAIHYAEKLGDYYRVCFFLVCKEVTYQKEGYRMVCIFGNNGFLGIESISQMSSKPRRIEISDRVKLPQNLAARLKLLGDGS